VKKKKKPDDDYFVSSISETSSLVAMTVFLTLIVVGIVLFLVT